MKKIYKKIVQTTFLTLSLGLSFGAFGQYCTPTYSTGCDFGDDLSSVVLTGNSVTLSNINSGCNGDYSDNTSMDAPDLTPGLTYSGEVATSYSYPEDESVRIWIDWDEDGVFDATDEVAAISGLASGMNAFSFTVPLTATPGTKRMRVRLVYSSNATSIDPCNQASFGETEDYSVEVEALEDCDGQPEAGSISGAESIQVCAAVPFTLSVTGFSTGGEITRQWQKSIDGGDTWEDIAGAQGANLYFPSGITEEADYRFYIICNISGLDAVTDPIHVSIKPANECYCEPSSQYTGDYISAFTTVGAIDNINMAGLTSTPIYHDYFDTDQITVAVAGDEFEFAASYDGGNATFNVWVDWNQNGAFEPTELMHTSDNSSVASGIITVPINADAGTYRFRIRARYGSGELEPCGQVTYGTTLDYSLVVLEGAEPCDGAPQIGAFTDLQKCESTSFTIVAEGLDSGLSGINYQWERSDDGGTTWAEIAGANSTSYEVVEGVTQTTLFRLIATCTNSGDITTSNTIEVTLKPANECYCEPTSQYTGDYISAFTTTGAIDNINMAGLTSTPIYHDYFDTDQITVAVAGDEFDFAASYVGGSATFNVWVDWNQNGIFDPSELMFTGYAGAVAGTITVPINADAGTYRLRIRGRYGSTSLEPCGEVTYGTTLDYSLVVIEGAEGCDGAPQIGAFDDLEKCADVDFTLTATGLDSGISGISYQWESSNDGGTTWNEIPGANSASHVVTSGINEPTHYRLVATCTNTGDITVSNSFEITLKPAEDCYCVPEATNSSYFINSFSTTGGAQNITNSNSGFSNGGYGDFSDLMSVEQMAGQTINFSATLSGGSAGFRIWVDWNQNGFFEETEEIAFQSSAYDDQHSGVIAIPADATPGVTRMRIASHWLSSTGAVDPCSTVHTYGEFEDYAFVILTIEQPTITQEAGTPDCQTGTELTLSGELEDDQTWYWQETANGTSLDNDANPYTVYENGTYYARTYDPDLNIWSLVSSITVTNLPTAPAPPTPVAEENPVCLPGTTISVEEAPESLVYYWQGTSSTSSSIENNANEPFEVTETGTYYVKAYETETNCWSEPVGLFVDVNEDVPNNPVADPAAFYFCENETEAEIFATTSFGADAVWYDAETGGNVIGTDNPLNIIGTSVMPTLEEGTYDFWVASDNGSCESVERTLVQVFVSNVNVELVAQDVSCNNGNDGSFYIGSDPECGNGPFTYSVDGGDFGTIPTDLEVGEYTVVVKDADGNLSGTYTVVIGDAEAPSELMVQSYSDTEATITWTVNGSETEWNIEWGLPGFVPGTGNALGTATSSENTYTITGLQENSEYAIYVSANCGGDNTPGAWATTGVATTCGPTDALGYCEDFNVLEDLQQDCWLVYDLNQDDNYWAWYEDEGVDGTGAIGIYTDFLNGATDDFIIVPKLILTGNEVMTYWHRANSATEPNSYQIIIGNHISFDQFDVVHQDTATTTTYQMVSVDLSDYEGEYFIAFHVPLGSLDGWYLFIDDLCIDICEPIAGIDGELDVCSDDETLDLNTVITSEYTHGTWIFPDNQGAVSGSDLNLTVLAGGTYELMYIVETSCTSDTTYATVTVYPPSSAGIGTTITVCKNQPIDLFSALTGNFDFGGDWYDYNGNLLDNSHPTAAQYQGNYNYTYIVSNGVCDADTTLVEVFVNGDCDWLSVNEESFSEISVYPNPTTDVINIVNPSNNSKLTLEVLDINGRIIMTDSELLKNSTEATVNIGSLAKGIYTLRVYNELGQKTFKIIKQ